VRVLDDRDLPEARELCAADPVANVFVSNRLEAAGLDPWRLGAEVWGYLDAGRLIALCFAGANLAPVQAGSRDSPVVHAFAERARRQGRRCSSFVGPAESVLGLWQLLDPSWGPAREVRPDQPLLAIDHDPCVELDSRVRRVLPHEIDVLMPASVAMFTEEVGVSPIVHDGGALYRARVAELVDAGRAYAIIEDDQVLFKAEVGAASAQACQVQGVWVDPRLRSRGLGTAASAAVVALARRDVAPVVSLYVNAFNLSARAAYRKVGFTQVGTFASVLF
jgi:predicted GNAT family acetyltransferase